MSDYIPAKDADFRDWATNFDLTINVDPTAYGLDAADGANISAAVLAYQNAYDDSQSPAKRTSPIIALKDNQRRACEQTCRKYAGIIQNVDSVTDQQLLDAGLTVRKTTPTPTTTPTDIPSLAFEGVLGGQVCLRLGNSSTPDSDGLPGNASSILLTLQEVDAENNPIPGTNTSSWICTPGQNYIPTWSNGFGKRFCAEAKFLAKRANDKGWKESGPASNPVYFTMTDD